MTSPIKTQVLKQNSSLHWFVVTERKVEAVGMAELKRLTKEYDHCDVIHVANDQFYNSSHFITKKVLLKILKEAGWLMEVS